MPRNYRGAFCALAVVLLMSLPLWGGTSRPVSLYFTVEDGDKLVSGLTENNFRLYEDGRPREFRLAAPESPVLVSVLVEYSQISGLYLNDIEAAVRSFMDAAPEGNWYSLATYSHGMTIHEDFTKQKGRILAAFAELGQPTWSEVDTYDAVNEMLEKLDLLRGRKVLIVIGSGLDTFSACSVDDVRKKIEATNVTVFAVSAGTLLRGQYDAYLGTGARMELTQAEAFFNMLAVKSGGQAFFPRFETAYKDIAQGIVTMLQQQYRILYDSEAPADGKFHRLKLEAFQLVDDKRKDFKPRVREGWRR
jgi:VWFA-related protein